MTQNILLLPRSDFSLSNQVTGCRRIHFSVFVMETTLAVEQYSSMCSKTFTEPGSLLYCIYMIEFSNLCIIGVSQNSQNCESLV